MKEENILEEQSEIKVKVKERYNFIDFLRGFALINMIAYHTLYDLVYIFGEKFNFFPSLFSDIWQNIIAMIFIITSGISYSFGKKNTKKFVILLICASILSIYTGFFMKDEFIAFGVIHFFAFGTLFLLIFDGILKFIHPYIGIVLNLILFIATRFITEGYIYLIQDKFYLPEILYDLKFLFWLGFPGDNFFSADYFPILPWIFLLLVGFYIGKLILRKEVKMKKKSYNPISFIGRHSLIVYMIHQPIIYAILAYIYKVDIF